MSDGLFEKKAEFISWCIESYAVEHDLNGRDVANYFSNKKVLDFLGNHYEILHTQGKSYILAAIDDFIKTGEEMTEWEKMRQGKVYNDFDKDLFQRRIVAKKLFRAYNKTEDEEIDERNQLLQKLFKSLGKNVWIEPDFRCEFGKNITIEDNVYINFGCVILDCAQVFIGSNSLLGPNIGIYAVNHSLDAEERIHGGCIGKPVHIGKNVWLGGDVKIMAGVTIGNNSVIGAGSVVTRNIPENVVAAGNPCRIIRSISEADKLENMKA